jgi:DNA-binding response OmpR family regulator/signal transduction histidine kinase
VEDGVLGLDLLNRKDGRLDAFLAWASEVDQILGPLGEDTFTHLVDAYTTRVAIAPKLLLESCLEEVAAWVQGINPEAEVSIRESMEWDLLLAAAATIRAATASGTVPVKQVSVRFRRSDQSLDQRAADEGAVSASGASAVEELLSWLSRADDAADVVHSARVRAMDDGLRVECAIPRDASERLTRLAGLLAESVPDVEIFVDESQIVLTLFYSPDPSERSIAAAGIQAYLTPRDQTGLENLANVLHRLKNELIGLEDATRKAQGADRLTRLERLTDAARHHVSACHLAEHLGRTRYAIGDADEDYLQLGRWLDEYCAAKTLELRPGFRMRPPIQAGQQEITISPSLLREVLDNLVKNSIEAMPDGGQISVNWHVEGDGAVVVVADEGPGLPNEVRDALRRDATLPSTKSSGSGLGLWLVRSAVRRMNGQLEDGQSAVGQTWLIKLPLDAAVEDEPVSSSAPDRVTVAETNAAVGGVDTRGPAEVPQSPEPVNARQEPGIPRSRRDAGEVRATEVAPAEGDAAETERRMRLRVLLVDDQENVARTMARHLDSVAAKVDLASDGEDAVQRLREQQYDVVVTDLQMPPGTWGGLWLLDQMRLKGYRTPVVVLSGEGGQAQTIDALHAGAAGYVVKSQAAEELAPRVDSVVRDLRRRAIAGLQDLPLPVALGLQRFEAEADPNVRLRFGHQALEDALRYLGAVGLGELGLNQISDDLRATLFSGNITMGKWARLGQLLVRALDLRSFSRGVLAGVDRERLRAAVEGRNQVGHGTEPENSRVEHMLADVTAVLEQFAAGFHRTIDRSVLIAQGLEYDGRLFSVSASRIVGTGPVLPNVKFLTPSPVARDSVGLHHDDGQLWTPAGPWLVAQAGRTRGEWLISAFDGSERPSGGRPAKIWYRAFGKSERWAAQADAELTAMMTRRVSS